VDGNDVQNRIRVFLIAAKLLDVNPENAIVLKILYRSSGSQYWKNESIGGEVCLYESKIRV
jgi:hypothetical protein